MITASAGGVVLTLGNGQTVAISQEEAWQLHEQLAAILAHHRPGREYWGDRKYDYPSTARQPWEAPFYYTSGTTCCNGE